MTIHLAAADGLELALRQLLHDAPAYIFHFRGPQHCVAFVNRQGRELLGDLPAPGCPAPQVFAGRLPPAFFAMLDQVYQTGRPAREPITPVRGRPTPHARPREMFVTFTYQPLQAADGSRAGIFVHGIDITEQVRARRAAEAQQEVQAAIFDAMPIGISTFDRALRLLNFNQEYARMVPLDPATARGQFYYDLVPAAREHQALHERVFAGESVEVEKVTYAHPDGTPRYCDVRYRPLRDGAGRVTGMLCTSIDVTEQQRVQEALTYQALYDPLTGLANRTLLADRLAHAIQQCTRAQAPQPLALLLLDLDRFKEVNDTFGHNQGDALLQQVARRLAGSVRAADTLARLGGDEFAVLLPGADSAGALQVVRKIMAALATPILVGSLPLQIGVSIGIALGAETLLTPAATEAQRLLRQADVAMYVAKRRGSGYALYDPAQDEHSPARLALFSALRTAIAQDALVLHYQPIVDLTSGRVVDVEALVRWPHPDFGLLGPDQFMPLAEQIELRGSFTAWLLGAVLRQSQRWQQEGLALPIRVNLSMANLHDRQLPDTLAALLAGYRIPPSLLRLEITETTAMADPGYTMEVLLRLAAIGVRLSIDDFGTGYSSLTYLKRLPVDELKIDRSFVLHMAEDDHDRAIVASTIGLAHGLRLQVVAEGVEDPATRDHLAALGCDAAQGFFFSAPLPPDAFSRWLQDSPHRPTPRPEPAPVSPAVYQVEIEQFLTRHRNTIAGLLEQAYAQAGGHYAAMTPTARHRQAAADSRDLITDLLRGGVPRSAIQQTVQTAERTGVAVDDIVRMVTAMETLFPAFIREQLADQPELAAELKRQAVPLITHFRTTLATMAAASAPRLGPDPGT